MTNYLGIKISKIDANEYASLIHYLELGALNYNSVGFTDVVKITTIVTESDEAALIRFITENITKMAVSIHSLGSRKTNTKIHKALMKELNNI